MIANLTNKGFVMLKEILSGVSVSVSDLKKNPMAVIREADGAPVAVLNRNTPAFYCVPAGTYRQMMDMLEDLELAEIVRQRDAEEVIELSIDEL